MKKTTLSVVANVVLASTLSAKETGVVVYSATKSAQSIQDVTSNVNIITRAELENKNISTVNEALASIPGVHIVSNGGLGATSTVQLRGMNNNRTLVLIDGVKAQDPSSTSGANLSHLLINDIERIEVIKGAQSGIWGADAAAGVINIITKTPKLGTAGSILVEVGSFSTKKVGATIGHKMKKFDVQLSAQKVESDSFSVQSPKGDDVDKYEDDPYKNTTLNLKAGFNINDDARIALNVNTIDALKDYDSFGNPDDTSMQSDIDNKLYGVNYTHTINNHTIGFKVEKSEFSRDEIGTVGTMWGEAVKVFEGESNNIEINDKMKYATNDFVLFGLGQSDDTVKYSMTDNTTNNQENTNNYLYLTNSNTFDRVILTQSIRYDKYDNFDNKATGKLGIKYNAEKGKYISANIGTAYNVPNIMQELNPWGTANDTLNPEDSRNFDLTIGIDPLKVTFFESTIKDLIDWDTATSQYKNLDGKNTFKGYEIEYKNNFGTSTLFTLNYTSLSAKDKDGKDLARRADETLKLSLDYYGIKKLHLGINGEYIGERKEYNWGGSLKAQTGRYSVINLVANYNVSRALKTYVKVENAGDKEYQTVDGYATSPRAYYAGLKYNF